MRMLRFALGVTRKDMIGNERIRGLAQFEQLRAKMKEDILRWYGHALGRGGEYVGRRMMEMELPGKRKREKPK